MKKFFLLSLIFLTACSGGSTDEQDSFSSSESDLPTDVQGVYLTTDRDFVEGSFLFLHGDCETLRNNISVALVPDGSQIRVDGEDVNYFGILDGHGFQVASSGCFFFFYKDTINKNRRAKFYCVLRPASEGQVCENWYE